jgi:hypothetical protein
MNIIIGNYKSNEANSLLEICEKIRSNYDGMLHAGIIHYIQGKMPDFTLKASISRVLDKCPSVWPIDLPEKIEKQEEVEFTEEMQKEFCALNEGLIMPIEPADIIDIIKYAKEFLAVNGITN